MNTLVSPLALAHHVLFMGFCVVAIILIVGIAMDAVSNLKDKQL